MALRHIAEAEEFTREMGGMDQDVKAYFFGLPSHELNALFVEYGRINGKDAESYARQTFNAWKSGQVRMSGLVAKRLFALLPPRMPPAKKLDLADNIWRHFGPSSSHTFSVGPTADITVVANTIAARLDAAVNVYTIPVNVKNRFSWLAAGDVRAEEQLLNHFRLLEKKLAVQKIQMEIPILQRQVINHPQTTALAQSEIHIHKHKVTIRVQKQLGGTIQEGFFASAPPPRPMPAAGPIYAPSGVPSAYYTPPRVHTRIPDYEPEGSGCGVYIVIGAIVAFLIAVF